MLDISLLPHSVRKKILLCYMQVSLAASAVDEGVLYLKKKYII